MFTYVIRCVEFDGGVSFAVTLPYGPAECTRTGAERETTDCRVKWIDIVLKLRMHTLTGLYHILE